MDHTVSTHSELSSNACSSGKSKAKGRSSSDAQAQSTAAKNKSSIKRNEKQNKDAPDNDRREKTDHTVSKKNINSTATKTKDNSVHPTDESKHYTMKAPGKKTAKSCSPNGQKDTDMSGNNNDEIVRHRRNGTSSNTIGKTVFQITNVSEDVQKHKTAEKSKTCSKGGKKQNKDISSKENEEVTECAASDKKNSNLKPKRLKHVVEGLKMKMSDISRAADEVNRFVTTILTSDSLKKDDLFGKINKMNTGSYYEKLKISKPNEFDIMLEIPVDEYRVIELTNVIGGFYTLSYKHRAPKTMVQYLDNDGNILASKILNNFRKLVVEALRQSGMGAQLQRKDPLSPAVTVLIGEKPNVVSVDLVLALKIQQAWPETTKNGMDIDNWLGSKVKRVFKKDPFYMVPKQANNGEENKTDTWRISFSNIEKKIIANHGHGKTCCEDKGEMCCRKQCLKLMKHLLELLKSNANKRKLDCFCSYHAKTALLHFCAKEPKDEDWKRENLDLCFDKYIDYFLTCLKVYTLPNFFIPSHNLFSAEFIDKACCDYLQGQIQNQKDEGYSLFYKE